MNGSKRIIKILKETKNIQDVVYDFMSSYYRNLLPGRMGEDTIPFMIITPKNKEGIFEALGFVYKPTDQCILTFHTNFFRIEEIHESENCITVSFLLPLTIEGEVANSVCDVFRLERTKCCIKVNINNICGVQFADPRLVNRKLPIIEPKW